MQNHYVFFITNKTATIIENIVFIRRFGLCVSHHQE